jgi:hypothetical protein
MLTQLAAMAPVLAAVISVVDGRLRARREQSRRAGDE